MSLEIDRKVPGQDQRVSNDARTIAGELLSKLPGIANALLVTQLQKSSRQFSQFLLELEQVEDIVAVDAMRLRVGIPSDLAVFRSFVQFHCRPFYSCMVGWFTRSWIQPIDATDWLNRSGGAS